MERNNLLRVAVIDDGINEELYSSIGCLDFNIEINRELTISQRKYRNKLLSSHGTTCAAIIKKYAPNVSLGSIKILDDHSKRSFRYQLISAIEWCIQNEINIINLSVGTIDFRDFEEIRDCVNEAYKNSLIIVAACNNKNIYTVPACLTNVIGVRCKKGYINEQYRFIRYSFDGIDVEASGEHLLTDIYGESKYTCISNSFAAPLITAMVYKILEKNRYKSFDRIREELHKGALNYTNDFNPYMCMNTDWIDKEMKLTKRSDRCFVKTHNNRKEIRKIWDPKFYSEQLKADLDKKQVNIDIPVIAIYNEGNVDLLENFSFLFRKEGYYSIKISTDYTNILNGCEYMPKNISIMGFIAIVYKKYFCDVILVEMRGRSCIDDIELSTIFDIIILNKINKNAYNYLHKNVGQTLILSSSICKSDKQQIENVFDKMLIILLIGV